MKSALVLLESFPSVVVAEMVADRLDAEGITAFVESEHTAHLFAGVEAVMGGVRVLVEAGDVEEARGVLANLSHPLGTAAPDLSEEELAVLAAAAEEEPAADPEPSGRGERRLRTLFLLIGAAVVAFVVVYVLVRSRPPVG
jgi:hypothetical protein